MKLPDIKAPQGYNFNQSYKDVVALHILIERLDERLNAFEEFAIDIAEAVKHGKDFQHAINAFVFKHMSTEYHQGKVLKPFAVDKRLKQLSEEVEGLRIDYTSETRPKVHEHKKSQEKGPGW